MKRVLEEAAAKEKAEFTKAIKKPPSRKAGVEQLTSKEILYGLHSNEDGDAWLFNAIHKDRFIYDHAAGQWHEWQGNHWSADETNEAMFGIAEIIDRYGREADRQAWEATKLAKSKATPEAIAECEKLREQLLNRIRLLQSASRKRNVLFLATVGAGLTGEEWDTGPMLLGCENGVIDLRTGTLRPGRQTDYIKTVAPTEYPGIDQETPPTWEKFLKDTFNNNTDLISYLQRLMGYGITGLKREHIIPILYGDGRNGKGTFLETVKFVLGSLAHKTKAETLLDTGRLKPSGSADADTLAFRGKRIVFAAETSQGSSLNAGKIKELAGGDTLNARAPYGRRPIEFEPTHLLLLMTNNKPQAPASDRALWYRINLIPFTLSFIDNPKKPNERQADKKLSEKLKKEASGILAWLVQGCLAWQKEGLNPPKSVINATNEYQKEMDIIGQWIDEKCTIDSNARIKAGDCYKAYQAWMEDMGHKPFSGTRFGKEMKTRFDSEKTNYVNYIGIDLLSDIVGG